MNFGVKWVLNKEIDCKNIVDDKLSVTRVVRGEIRDECT